MPATEGWVCAFYPRDLDPQRDGAVVDTLRKLWRLAKLLERTGPR